MTGFLNGIIAVFAAVVDLAVFERDAVLGEELIDGEAHIAVLFQVLHDLACGFSGIFLDVVAEDDIAVVNLAFDGVQDLIRRAAAPVMTMGG